MNRKASYVYNKTFGNRYLVLAVCVCLILILMGILSGRLEHEFNQVEKVQFEHRVAELRAAVRLIEANLISQSQLYRASQFEGVNPMDWLEDDTSHYLGVIKSEDALNHPGNWFFDADLNAISFVPYRSKTDAETKNQQESLDKILRFKVRALRSKELESKYSGLVLEQLNTQKKRHSL